PEESEIKAVQQQEPPMYNDQNNNDDAEPSPPPFEKNTSESNSVLAKIDEQYRAKQQQSTRNGDDL
ncbi:hypothetical protein A2U01_0082670, partial [Trifolium medium]|nr:hypothetical protein [Trifolium medium]